MKHARPATPFTIDFDAWRTQLNNLIDRSQNIVRALSQAEKGDIPDVVAQLVAEREEILRRLTQLGETLRRESNITIPNDVRELYETAKTLDDEGLRLMRSHRAHILEEIKKIDRHQSNRNPYRTTQN